MQGTTATRGDAHEGETATVSLVNRKGGCGTTTILSNLCDPLVRLLRTRHGPTARLLVVDTDPLCGATSLFTGLDPDTLTRTVSTVLTRQHQVTDAVIALDTADTGLAPTIAAARTGVSLLPNNARATPRLGNAADLIVLRELLADHPLPDVRMVLFDAGAAASDLAEAALVASQQIVAVTTPNALDAHGLNLLMRKLRWMNRRFAHLRLSGVIVNRVEDRHVADLEVLDDLTAQLGDRLWRPVVPYAGAIKRANNRHLPITATGLARTDLVEVFRSLAEHLLPPPL